MWFRMASGGCSVLATSYSEGRKATRVAYESYFAAFPDLDSDYHRFAAGDDVLVGWAC